MAKDYAKRVFTAHPKRKKKRLRWQWVFIILIIIIGAICYFSYKHKNVETTSFLGKFKAIFVHTHPPVAPKTVAETPTDPDIHFDFYNQLPSMKVSANVAETPKTAGGEAPAHFILVLGLYKDASAASQTRISLLLSGCEAQVVKIKSKEADIYRLQLGPFSNQAEAVKQQHQWEKQGIEGVVKKA